METPQTSRPRTRQKLATLTVELSNARTDRARRVHNRTESYTLGLAGDGTSFSPPYDLFSFCCYRALLLGSPGVIIRATLQPGKRKLLTEPLPPQRLKGEDEVEECEREKRAALSFLMQPSQGRHFSRRFFGFRASHAHGSMEWLCYEPSLAVLDRETGAPPTFEDVADFESRSQTLAAGRPLTKEQAWSTWFWLLINRTFHATRCPDSADVSLVRLWPDHGISFPRVVIVKHGC